MKKYLKDLILILLQLVVFYLLPNFADPSDVMGLVVLIIVLTFILSIAEGTISKHQLKFIYPIIISIIFIPSIYIFYNSSALIYIVWYLVISSLGLLIGSLLRKIIWKKK